MLNFKPDETHELGEKWPRLSSISQSYWPACPEGRGNVETEHCADALFVEAEPLEPV